MLDRLDAEGRILIAPPFRRLLPGRVVQVLTPRGVLLRSVPDRLDDGGRLPPAATATGEDVA